MKRFFSTLAALALALPVFAASQNERIVAVETNGVGVLALTNLAAGVIRYDARIINLSTNILFASTTASNCQFTVYTDIVLATNGTVLTQTTNTVYGPIRLAPAGSEGDSIFFQGRFSDGRTLGGQLWVGRPGGTGANFFGVVESLNR